MRPAKRPDYHGGLQSALSRLEKETGYKLDPETIPAGMTFTAWCEKLGEDGLKVDGMPFSLANRPAMRFVYDLIPSTIEAAFGKLLILMKCAQVGFTVLEMLAAIYLALKFEPCKVGLYLPDMKLAGAKSTHRFLPILRTVPVAYKKLTTEPADGGRKSGEGNVMIRQMGESRFHFLWTSGAAMTESFPLDVLTFDEVQGMLTADMEKTMERLSASRIKLTVMGSTAMWPDADIDFWYKQGTRHRFHTECPHCANAEPLDEYFPECIGFDEKRKDFVYVCRKCEGVIEDSQRGRWIAEAPAAEHTSVHFHQMLSPTVSPREIIGKYQRAQDMQNFWNRVLGKPYADPTQIPISLPILLACVEEGKGAGVKWKTRAAGTFMGIDQMGAFNVIIIKERLPDGRQAVIHVEEIYSNDPFQRCDELMAGYGVEICVVEQLPNYNDAKRFAARHKGRVFLAAYGDMPEEMMRWGDAVVTKADRKTAEDERDRYTVLLDQYKCMQVAMARMVNKNCLFPDPAELVQEVVDRGLKVKMPLLRDRVFLHFQKTALVTERPDEDVKKYRRKVVKVGIDPHFSYANMLCDIAWARNHGTGMMMLPQKEGADQHLRAKSAAMNMPGLPAGVVEMMQAAPAGEVCGRCTAYPADGGERALCGERALIVRARDAGCPIFVAKDGG